MISKQAFHTIRTILSTQTKRHSGTNHRPSTMLRPLLHTSTPKQQHHPQKIISSYFHTESDFHNAADHTLNTIQDTLDYYFEDNPHLDTPDIDYASGVLTISLTKGIWVMNKQTPNEQIWWSSPLSGPRRYEFDEDGGKKWIWSRYVDHKDSNDADKVGWKDTMHLGEALKKELVELYELEDGLEDLDDL